MKDPQTIFMEFRNVIDNIDLMVKSISELEEAARTFSADVNRVVGNSWIGQDADAFKNQLATLLGVPNMGRGSVLYHGEAMKKIAQQLRVEAERKREAELRAYNEFMQKLRTNA